LNHCSCRQAIKVTVWVENSNYKLWCSVYS